MSLDYLGEAYFKDGHHIASFLYGKRELEEIRNKKIIVWGCGMAAFLLCEKLKDVGIEVHSFCDNDKKLFGEELFGKSIIPLSDAFEFAKDHNGYFILTMTGRNLDLVIRQIMIRFGDEWSCFFNSPIGNYYSDDKLLSIVIGSIKNVLGASLFRKKMQWHECIRGNRFNEYLYLSIMSTKFWDNFIKFFYNQHLNGKILDIGPGFGTCSLILKEIDNNNSIDWLCYSFNERVENDYICPQGELYPVKRIYGEIQNPDFDIDEKYDYIILCEVMEHFKFNPVPTVKKIATWLKSGGMIFFSTPTPESDATKIYETYKDMPQYKNNDGVARESNYLDQSEEHQYIYSENELRDIFKECELTVLEYKRIYNHHRLILKK